MDGEDTRRSAGMSGRLLLVAAALLEPGSALTPGLRKAFGYRSSGQKTAVSDFMARNVVALQDSSSLSEAAQLLVDKKIRGAPVVNKDGKLVGVLSQFDFLYKAAGRRAPGRGVGARSERFAQNAARWDKIEAQTVGDAMSAAPFTVKEDTSMQEAAALLLEKKIGRLIVVDDDNSLVGLLSCTDMMELVLSGQLDL